MRDDRQYFLFDQIELECIEIWFVHFEAWTFFEGCVEEPWSNYTLNEFFIFLWNFAEDGVEVTVFFLQTFLPLLSC